MHIVFSSKIGWGTFNVKLLFLFLSSLAHPMMQLFSKKVVYTWSKGSLSQCQFEKKTMKTVLKLLNDIQFNLHNIQTEMLKHLGTL